jgi:hypothetical protein
MNSPYLELLLTIYSKGKRYAANVIRDNDNRINDKPSIFFFGKMTLDFDGSKRWKEDHRGVDLISDALPFGRLWYGEPEAISNAIGYAKFYSRAHDAVIRVYDDADNVIETHEHTGDFREP